MRILVVDDEAPARQRLRRLIGTLKGHECCAEAANGQEALRLNEALRPDLILLDIRMPDMDGLQVARKLGEQKMPPEIVFTTAFDQFAIDAFDTKARHYPVKPARKEKLCEALERVEEVRSPAQEAGYDAEEMLRIFHKGAVKLIPVTEILYCRADHKYTQVRTRAEAYLIDDSLTQLERRFSGLFTRVHRGALVNRQEILILESARGSHFLRFRDVDDAVEVSRRHLASVRAMFKPSDK